MLEKNIKNNNRNRFIEKYLYHFYRYIEYTISRYVAGSLIQRINVLFLAILSDCNTFSYKKFIKQFFAIDFNSITEGQARCDKFHFLLVS